MPYCFQCRRDFKVLPACPQCGLPLVPRATAGFAISALAGAIILLTGLLMLIFPIFYAWIIFLLNLLGLGILASLGLILVMIAIIAGILIIVGAALIYLPKKENAGAGLVLIFSIVSIVVLGGFIVGITMGIIGAALGFAKK